MNTAANSKSTETTDPSTWAISCDRCTAKGCDGTDCARPLTRSEACAGGRVYRWRFGKPV